METLIVILIVVMIAQTVLFIYTNFIDLSQRRQSASVQEALTNAHADFVNEKKRLEQQLDQKVKDIRELQAQYGPLRGELVQYHHLSRMAGYDNNIEAALRRLIELKDIENPPVLPSELEDRITQLVMDYIDRGDINDNPEESVDLDFGVKTSRGEYAITLKCEKLKDEDFDKSVQSV